MVSAQSLQHCHKHVNGPEHRGGACSEIAVSVRTVAMDYGVVSNELLVTDDLRHNAL